MTAEAPGAPSGAARHLPVTGARRLIVTADDFGAAPEVNDAVADAHVHGILTAASLMVGAPAVAHAVALAKALPELGVGLHLVLVDGVPVLPAAQVPDLVDARGRFRDDMVRAGFAFAFNPAARRQLRAEIAAQFAAFAATGLALDHVNAHKHFHLHPVVAGMILDIGQAHGMRSVRAPVEPVAVVRGAGDARAAGNIATPWAKLMRARLRRAGMTVPGAVFGLRWSGHMTALRLAALIERLPHGLNEIYLHPATSDVFDGHGPGYDHRGEYAALTDPRTRAALKASGVRIGRFADFAGEWTA